MWYGGADPAGVEGVETAEVDDRDADDIIETAEEIEAYYAVKALLLGSVDISRVVLKPGKSYARIQLDGHSRKHICRLYFNSPKRKYVGLFDKGKEERVRIDKLDDILKYRGRIKATVDKYLIPPSTTE